MKRQLKKSVVYTLYAASIGLTAGGVGLLATTLINPTKPVDSYVSKGVMDYEEQIPVVNTTTTLRRPYNEEGLELVKSYYDYKAEAETQEKSLIYYEGTYIPSSGVFYSGKDSFDVVSVLDGTVKEVKEDTNLGNVITIEHENGIVSVYQSVSDILVGEGSTVSQGQVIAKSSTSNISKELDNHLYFELMVNGNCVNPEIYYDKAVNELGA